MKKIWIAVILCVIAFGHSYAAGPKQNNSKTFAEILTRVIARDKDSGAILRVKMKEDAPSLGRGELLFEM